MREILLKKIDEIKVKEKNFPQSKMRWQRVNLKTNNGLFHISQVEFPVLTDKQLVDAFETIVKNMYCQI